MADTLLDLPDELLIRCLAGSGGQGIACSAVACTRLHGLQQRLRQLPVFSSAMSTLPSLQHAIRDAGQRALTGCYGAVDFALLFVANYGNARGKKYNDPNDLAHSVDMLREVLGQDAVIVGCACAGLMGVGPDSAPVEVDPQSNTSRGRAAAAEAKRAGRSPPPTKGVSVLLGKLPPGCVARAFAQEVLEGPPVPADPQSPPASWSWPLLDEALALTSSQKAALAQQLASLAPTAAQHTPAGGAAAAVGQDSRMGLCPAAAQGGVPVTGVSPVHQQPAAQAAAELGASPATAAAAEGLLSVVAAAAAAAATEPANSAPAAGSPADDVVLVPQLCLMLYDTSLQSFGYTESPDMERALTYLAAKGVLVTGGASSGAGDLFFSPGADGRRVTGEPSFTNNPQIVGLMLCTARAPAPAPAAVAASTAQAPALPAASPAGPLDTTALEIPTAIATGRDDAAATAVSNGASSKGQAATAAAAWLDSSASLHTAACAALGLGPSEQGPLFTDVRAKIGYSHALSVNHLAVQLQVDRCSMIAPPAQAAPAPSQHQDATAAAAATDAAAADIVSPEAAQAATADAAAPASSAAVRRSARLAAAATTGPGDGGSSQAAPVALTPLHHLYAAVTAGAPVAAFDDGDEDDSGQYLAVWVCGQGDKPAAFTGDEAQVAICELLACELESRAGPAVPGSNSNGSSGSNSHDSSSDYVEITAAVHVSSYTALRDIINSAPPGSSLCCQVVGTRGPACAGTIRRCLTQMLPALHQHMPATVSAATAARATATATPTAATGCGGVGAGRAMADCYDALSRGAVASGARSGLAGVAVCSCTGRGQALYADGAEAPATAFGAVSEAQIVDAVGRAGLPFVGAYVSGELGPEVRHMCSGWFKRDGRTGGVDAAEMQGFTSIFAGWGCQPGVA